jgi:hypothetical protein
VFTRASGPKGTSIEDVEKRVKFVKKPDFSDYYKMGYYL